MEEDTGYDIKLELEEHEDLGMTRRGEDSIISVQVKQEQVEADFDEKLEKGKRTACISVYQSNQESIKKSGRDIAVITPSN